MKQRAFEIEPSEHPAHGPLFSWVRIEKQETTILKATLLVNILVGLILLVPEIARGAETLQKIRIGFPSLAFSLHALLRGERKRAAKKIWAGSRVHPDAHHDSAPSGHQRQP